MPLVQPLGAAPSVHNEKQRAFEMKDFASQTLETSLL
jgi:hypothetical protein